MAINLVEVNIVKLKQKHYVRKGYWFDFSKKKMEQIIGLMKDDFYIIIYGDSNTADDYYVIPYKIVSNYFREEALARERRNNQRWIGSIHKDHMFTVKAEPRLDISSYYGNRTFLDKALGK